MTGFVDPWAGANQTTQTLANLGKQIDEEKRSALAEQLTRQQISQNRMTLADLDRKRKVEKGALDAVANAQPTTATTFAPAEQPTEIAGRFAPNPEFTEVTGRVTKPPNHDRVLLDYYKAHDPEKALGMEKLLMDKFKSLSEIAPESAIEWYNDFAGTDFKFTGKKGDYSYLQDGKTGSIVAVNSRDPKDIRVVREGERALLVVAPGSTVLGPDNQPVFTADPKAEYKSRTRNIGDKELFEESQDGGKTWKQVGEPAPRYKPSGGGTTIMQSTFVDPATGNPLIFDKATGTYKVATISGWGGVAPKPSAMTPETAGKAQMVEQAIGYIPTLRQELFDADGSVNRTNVANLVARTWGTRGRELSTLILDAVEAKLRVESGAAVPDSEVKRAAKRFVPEIGDSANNLKIKLDNLETFLKKTTEKINRGRQPDKKPGGKKADPLGIL